jgi:hypothetical protein
MSTDGAMRALLKPLILVMAIPVLASAVGVAGRGQFEARWNQMLVRRLAIQRLRPTPRFLAVNSLPVLCSDARNASRIPECSTYGLFAGTVSGATAVAGLGLVVLAGLVAGRRLVRPDRPGGAPLFRPALWFAAMAVAVLAVAHGALCVAAYVLLVAAGLAPNLLVAAVAMASVAAVVSMIGVTLSLTRRSAVTVVGRWLDLSAQPALADLLREVAVQTRGTMPDRVVGGLTPGLFMTEARVTCLDGVSAGRTLYLSLAWCRVLTAAEFRALVAREFAPYAAAEEASTRLLSSYAAVNRRLMSLRFHARGIRAVAVAPPVALLSLLFDSPDAVERASRERAAAADRVAAGIAGPVAFGLALAKVQRFEAAWRRVTAAMADAVAGGTRYVNSGALFAEAVAEDVAFSGRLPGDAGWAVPVFGETAPDASGPASALIDGSESLEEDLTEVQHVLVSHHVSA